MVALQLVAHRGYTEHYPENTLVSMEAAIRAGARALELDIQLSADEVPVLLHDRTLQRVCNAKGVVHHLPYGQLRRLQPTGMWIAPCQVGLRAADPHLAGRFSEVEACETC